MGAQCDIAVITYFMTVESIITTQTFSCSFHIKS